MGRAKRVGGALLALIGAVGVTASGYLFWFDDRAATDITYERLFWTNVDDQATSYWSSVALPLAVVAVLGMAGAILMSRLLILLAWLVGLATLTLYVVMQTIHSGGLHPNEIQAGAWACAVGLLVMALGLVAMGRRPPPEPDDFDDDDAGDTGGDAGDDITRPGELATRPTAQGRYGAGATGEQRPGAPATGARPEQPGTRPGLGHQATYVRRSVPAAPNPPPEGSRPPW